MGVDTLIGGAAGALGGATSFGLSKAVPAMARSSVNILARAGSSRVSSRRVNRESRVLSKERDRTPQTTESTLAGAVTLGDTLLRLGPEPQRGRGSVLPQAFSRRNLVRQ